MLKPMLLSAAIALASCGLLEKSKKPIEDGVDVLYTSEERNRAALALEFINAYVENLNKNEEALGMQEWVNSSPLVTTFFKHELYRIIETAFQEDPEMGLDVDPILAAQDYPEEGFELELFDSDTNFLIVRGKNMHEHKVTIKVAHENDSWLVDGCGMVNIPEVKQVGME